DVPSVIASTVAAGLFHLQHGAQFREQVGLYRVLDRAALLVSFEQSGLGKFFQVVGNHRLGDAKDVGQFGNGDWPAAAGSWLGQDVKSGGVCQHIEVFSVALFIVISVWTVG